MNYIALVLTVDFEERKSNSILRNGDEYRTGLNNPYRKFEPFLLLYVIPKNSI